MEPALYDAFNKKQVATFCIGAFWDEFMRKNCEATKGAVSYTHLDVYKRQAPV